MDAMELEAAAQGINKCVQNTDPQSDVLLTEDDQSSSVGPKKGLPNSKLIIGDNAGGHQAMKRSKRRNILVEEELDCDTDKLMSQHKKLKQRMNSAQREIFETVIESIKKKQGGLYFVYGSGGTGKTYLWRTIITGLRAQGKIVLAVASSGIASLLLPGGRTAHSRFKIPISLDENSTCDVSQGTMLVELICKADIIIWDEAPMINKPDFFGGYGDLMGVVLLKKSSQLQSKNHDNFIKSSQLQSKNHDDFWRPQSPLNHRSPQEKQVNKHAFKALERTVRDLMNKTGDKRNENLFGGKTLLMGGDFRQFLPVVRGGSREDIVRASISESYLWKYVRLFQLTENMRLANKNTSPEENKTITEFSKWILDLGNGKLPAKAISGEEDEATWIKIPADLLVTCDGDQDPIEAITEAIYPDLITNYRDKKYLKERCILSPKEQEVDIINDIMVAKIPSNERVYYSSDSTSPLSMEFADAEMTYNQMYLNSQKLSGVPNHILRLKVGLPVMLTRNLNLSAGLCNGTRLIVTLLKENSIEATVLTGPGAGRKVNIQRIVLELMESHLPFILRRVQLPIKVCFAMTINKSQGQSIDNVGIYLPKPTFTHGQLYVAVSRTTSRKGLKILMQKTKEAVPKDYTQNTVYKEIFSNLKPCNKGNETSAEYGTEGEPDDGTSHTDNKLRDDEEGCLVQRKAAKVDQPHNWRELLPYMLNDSGDTELGNDVGPLTKPEVDDHGMQDGDDSLNM